MQQLAERLGLGQTDLPDLFCIAHVQHRGADDARQDTVVHERVQLIPRDQSIAVGVEPPRRTRGSSALVRASV